MAAPLDLTAALMAAAKEINTKVSLPETLQSIVDVARDSTPDIDHVSITLKHRDGRLETASATDSVALALDQIQYDLRQGPCVSAAQETSELVVVAENVRHQGEWRDFVSQALPHGLRAVLAVRLFTGDKPAGVLNMYSTTSDTIAVETRAVAELLAVHAAYAYGYRRELNNLYTALESRELIGNAVGIVMQRYELNRQLAFEYLVRVSATSELKLRDVAERLIGQFETHVGTS